MTSDFGDLVATPKNQENVKMSQMSQSSTCLHCYTYRQRSHEKNTIRKESRQKQPPSATCMEEDSTWETSIIGRKRSSTEEEEGCTSRKRSSNETTCQESSSTEPAPSSKVYGGGNINDGRGISTHDEEKEIVEKTSGKHRAVGRRGRGSSLRIICLKRHCLSKIIELLILEPITSNTRDVLVKMPTILFAEISNSFELDLNNSRKIDLMHLTYAVILQRSFSLDIQSLYHEVCKLFVRKCGFITTDKISFSARNFSLKILRDLKDLLAFDYWYHLLSKIQQERFPSTHFKDN